MSISRQNWRLFAGSALAAVVVSTLAAVVVTTGNRVTEVPVYDRHWQEVAERDASRAAEASRAELIRWQNEHRRSAAHAMLRLENDISLYARTPSAAYSQMSCPALPVAGTRSPLLGGIFGERGDGTLPIGIGDQASTRVGRQVVGASPSWWADTLTPPARLEAWGADIAAAHGHLSTWAGRDAQRGSAGGTAHAIPLFPSDSDARGRQGIAQVRNHSLHSADVRIVAVDDSGREYGPLRLFVEANGVAEFDSGDIENGNPDRGLYGGTGPGLGDWRLELSSDAEIEALSFVRASDGVLMPMHDVVASEGNRHRVPIFHPGSQWEQESRLRLTNPGDGPAHVLITGIDSHGQSPGTGVSVTIPAGASVTYTSAELESGNGVGLRGWLGDGMGEWRLVVDSAQPLQVMNLLSSPTGHLSNLSTVPSNETQGVHGVPLLPSAADSSGRLGLVRVINRTDTAGEVRIKAFDDTQWDYAPLVLSLGAGETVQFDSNDLEQGNSGMSLSGGTGPGQGDWRLELSTELDIEVLSYVRSWDGLLTSMHDVVPGNGNQYRVASFNSHSDSGQESRLRLINPGSEAAQVTISGAHGFGASPGREVSLSIPARAARTYTAAELVSGKGAGLAGWLGESTGGQSLIVESGQPLQVMSLLSGPAGHLSNLSTAPMSIATAPVSIARMPSVYTTDTDTPGAETPEEVFGEEISPVVQAKCVACHRAGGFPADAPNSRLQFSPSTVEDHEALNLAAFEAFITVLEEDEQVEDPVTYVLNKVQGVNHGGAVQAAAGTDDYASLERFLGLLDEAVAPVGITPETLFAGVTIELPRQTLRRAAIVFAGRVPTEEEYAAIADVSGEEGASEAALRTAIRGLMTGPEFHEFLTRASNDRLFTDRDGSVIGEFDGFDDFARKISSLQSAGDDEAANRYDRQAQYGFRRAPLELIAHVAENDLPYTEILTADYVMANPMAAEAFGAATAFENPDDVHEFKPSDIGTYYRPCEGRYVRRGEGYFLIDSGPCATQLPYAGVLNSKVFLQRYPTTATNRNRARSRWTYYHFLGLDIEESASRTTDPDALADTNNPTMNNPACTVCHTVLDPVAGAFQNYGDEGLYRDQWGGMDTLDEMYKYNPTGREDFSIETRSKEDSLTLLATRRLFAEHDQEIGMKNLSTFEGDTKLHLALGKVTVSDSNGDVVNEYNIRDVVSDEDCGAPHGDDAYFLWDCDELLLLPLSVEEDGEYRIEIEAWVIEPGEVAATMQVWMGGPFYRQGDTWYRDMRSPGFDGSSPASAHDSLRWLAEQIVADPLFAEAAVKFWWPAIMGAEVAEPPEDENDADFEGLLLASNAQAGEVTRLADGFRSGFGEGSPYNLKDLLVEIVLSKWFRAESVSEDDTVRAVGLGNVGARRLLTPEELASKTLALTGFQWGRYRGKNWLPLHLREGNTLSDTEGGYGLLYGGIDSDGVTERARDLTSVMAGVAQSHALQSSSPIVMRELYLLPEEQRKLFADVDIAVTPTFEFGETFTIENDSSTDKGLFSVRGSLNSGSMTVSISFPNDFYQEEPREDRNVRLDRLDVRNASGGIVHTVELEDLEATSDCNYPVNDHFALHCSGSLSVPIEVPADGEYQIEVVAWADQGGEDLPVLEIALNSDTAGSVGADRIKSKLVELQDKLLGISVTADSAEVQDAYALFVEVWERNREAGHDHFLWNEENINIDWASDEYFFDGIADDLWRQELDENGNELGWDWDSDAMDNFFDGIDWSDPQAVARTWSVVLAYLMMDYRYLYL